MLSLNKYRRAANATLAALLLDGCTVQQVLPGMTRAEVLAQYGKPSREVPIANGASVSRLQYSFQPSGQQALMVDLDATGKVVLTRQVMQSAEFARIVVNQWSRADVEREFGPGATIDRVASWKGDIMTYYWKDASQDMYFYVYLDSANIVQRTGRGMDFRKEPPRD
ncbi:MAG: hypothetical protein HQ446_06075 [Polaromonas sp.]|nr:hypothetical protein [Polaromonas sp.]